MKYKLSNDVYYSCRFQVVWCTKYRRKILVDNIVYRLKELLQEICNKLSADLISVDIMPDHVVLLLEVAPQFGIHRTVKCLKGQTSRILRSEFKILTTRVPTLWTNYYSVSTIGKPTAIDIEDYLNTQKNN